MISRLSARHTLRFTLMAAVTLMMPLAGIPYGKALAEDASTEMPMRSRHFDEHMDKVDSNLEKMRHMMHRIQQTDDSGKRQSMMNQHRQMMHETMQMMHGSNDGGEEVKCGTIGRHMMGMHGDGEGMHMDNKSMTMNQHMMGRCMEAQHQMMQQMMEHEHMGSHQGKHR